MVSGPGAGANRGDTVIGALVWGGGASCDDVDNEGCGGTNCGTPTSSPGEEAIGCVVTVRDGGGAN